MNAPCFNPAPAWLQIPVIILCFLVIGFMGGFAFGVLAYKFFSQYIDDLLEDWFPKDKKEKQ